MEMYPREEVIHTEGTQLPSIVVAGYYSPGALSVLKRNTKVKENQPKNFYTLSRVNGFFAAYEETARYIMAYYNENFFGFDSLVTLTS